MSLGILFLILAILLLGLFSLTTVNSVFRRLPKRDLKKQLHLIGKLFFYRYLHRFFFREHESESLFFASIFTQNILRFLYALISLFILFNTGLLSFASSNSSKFTSLLINFPMGVLNLLGFFVVFFVIGDYLPRFFGARYPKLAIRLSTIPASLFMLITFPVTFILLKLSQLFTHPLYLHHLIEPHAEATQEIIDLLQESGTNNHLDIHDKKLFESVMEFKDRIAREVMVPRVDVFSLSHNTSIEEAAKLVLTEGYSRIPVYKNNLDNIVGVLMYKDVLTKYIEYAEKNNDIKILKTPIETLVKNVLYTPETKKISQLLQEFRKKQVHLAIIVDEYGGTEGIVTIEDILEEIVGDIADEYDKEEILFINLPDGGWLIDARMNILDVAEELNIEIPQEGDYDTIGGYIFHETGMIPSKGYIIRQPNFELEVLRSNDRRVEKVRIKPLFSSTNTDSHENDHENN